MKAYPYLIFNGNCREAFQHYAGALRGTVAALFTHADMPGGEEVPADQRNLILHARLEAGEVVLMGSDSPPERYAPPQGVYVSLHPETVPEAERLYQALSERGEIIMPIGETFWAARFAMFKDRFGIPWMINCEARSG